MERMVYAHMVDAVTKRLDRLAQKAARYDVPFSYSVGAEHPQIVNVYAFDYINHEQYIDKTYTVAAVDITVECEGLVKANGWRVLARIEHGDKGNIVAGFSGAEIAPEWYTVRSRCDHCGTNRARSVTFIVEHDDGTRRQIGRSCLKDYTGILPHVALMFAEVTNIFPSMDCMASEWSERAPAIMYPVCEVLAHAYDEIKARGYVKSASHNSTVESVIDKVRAGATPSAEGTAEAENIVRWLVSLGDDVIGIERDCKPLALSGYAKIRHFGLLAYMPVAYKKAMARKAREEERAKELANAAKHSQHVGSIGDRVEFVAKKAEFITSWETMYGHTFLYKFTDESGNVYVWFASGAFDEHNGIKVRGTVKKHDERDGVKQTVLTRCKIT